MLFYLSFPRMEHRNGSPSTLQNSLQGKAKFQIALKWNNCSKKSFHPVKVVPDTDFFAGVSRCMAVSNAPHLVTCEVFQRV